MGEGRLNIAYYVTGHGLGHATRVVEICKQLVATGHNVHIVTAASQTVFTREIPSLQLSVRRAVLDCGSKQQDAFSVDMKGTLELYQEAVVDRREAILATEVDCSNSLGCCGRSAYSVRSCSCCRSTCCGCVQLQLG